uniref:Deacetylase sirtuin-type domain-containing protein n=1 Tax=Panagrolaimus sp. JU765 TaxID=591449 RepID=A0AC34QIS7_9BILA
MAVNYADGLSPYMDKGVVGRPEIFDDRATFLEKTRQLAKDIQEAKFVVFLVGAGISTSAGIPDFRGPNGVWTLEEQGLTAPSIDFAEALPTFTHHALVALERRGIVKHLISQNVDGLLLKAGFPADRLMEVHGNFFVEKCNRCNTLYYNDHPSAAFGLMKPKKEVLCTRERCRGRVFSTVLDWEQRLPGKYFELSERYVKSADLLVVLGSSLEINPVGDLPKLAKSHKIKTVAVNLQDIKKCGITYKIHARVDDVMEKVMSLLHIQFNPEIHYYHKPIMHSTFPLSEDNLAPLKALKRKSTDSSTSGAKKRKSTKKEADETAITKDEEKELIKDESKIIESEPAAVTTTDEKVIDENAVVEAKEEELVKDEKSEMLETENVAEMVVPAAKAVSTDTVTDNSEGAQASESTDETVCSFGPVTPDEDVSADCLPEIMDGDDDSSQVNDS